MCRRLVGAECAILDALGSVAPFEIAVGSNGRIWLDAKEDTAIMLAQTAILQSQSLESSKHFQLLP